MTPATAMPIRTRQDPLRHNIILSTDSYKLSHWRMYPPKTEYVESYFEAREGGEFRESVFFGLKYLLNTYLAGVQVTRDDIGEADQFCKQHFGQDLFNIEGWNHILDKHGGRLPVSIRAVPEGTVVPEGNVLLTITNTDPQVPWLVNHLETLLVELWYPSTVATISRENKKILKPALERSADSMDKLPFMLHDFGFRGATSVESAALGGAGHLVNFSGTDTIAAINLIKTHYGEDMAGYSVPAAEHSTITSWGKMGETDAYRHILQQYREGIVSVVSDSWDILYACNTIWGSELKEAVLSNPDRTVVVRPDSGHPAQMVPDVLGWLGHNFGYEINNKGYKVLPPQVRVIQGDGIDRRSLPQIVDVVLARGWSLENLVFGSGGGLLQDCTRDTLRYAMKCCWAQIDGKSRDVTKRPASDPTKNSKSGLLKLIRKPNGTIRTVSVDDHGEDMMYEVFRDGDVWTNPGFEEIRARAEL